MLTQAHTGHWYDPAQSGQGFEIHVLPAGNLVVSAYFGRIPGYSNAPTFVSFQGGQESGAPVTGYVPRGCVFGEAGELSLAAIGEATFEPVDGRIVATVTIDQRGIDQPSPIAPPITVTFDLERLI